MGERSYSLRKKTAVSHPWRYKKNRYIPLSSTAEQSLVNRGSGYKMLTFFPVCLYSLFPSHQTLRAESPQWKKNEIAYNNPCATPPRRDLWMLASPVISASQVLVPFFLNPPRTHWGWGDRSQIPAPTPLPPPHSLPSTAGEKYGALCCVQCRLINFVSCLLPNRKYRRCVQARLIGNQNTEGCVSYCVVELFCHESMLQRQKEEETNIQRNGAVKKPSGRWCEYFRHHN